MELLPIRLDSRLTCGATIVSCLTRSRDRGRCELGDDHVRSVGCARRGPDSKRASANPKTKRSDHASLRAGELATQSRGDDARLTQSGLPNRERRASQLARVPARRANKEERTFGNMADLASRVPTEKRYPASARRSKASREDRQCGQPESK